jgi:hypothetical protein
VLRLSFGLLVLALIGGGSTASTPTTFAWPHRAILTSPVGRPVPFRAYTLGGDLIIAVDASGRRTATPAAIPTLRALTTKDTIRAETPADFPLDLAKGPVVFVAEGSDSLHVVVGWNPYGSIDQVRATGRRFTVRLVAGKFVIDKE